MKMIVAPGSKAVGSVSVGGREYKIKNGVVDNVPDHLAPQLEQHGFIAEGTLISQLAGEAMAKQAEETNNREAQAATERVKAKVKEAQEKGINPVTGAGPEA